MEKNLLGEDTSSRERRKPINVRSKNPRKYYDICTIKH
jgi:hypothetical protein